MQLFHAFSSRRSFLFSLRVFTEILDVYKRQVSLILKSGGFPVLAHPMRYHLSWKEVESLTVRLTEAGLQGLEVYYSSHTSEQSRKLRELCRRLQLLPTGGSDFHGAKKPDIHMGTGYGGLRVSELLLKDILAFRKEQGFQCGEI